jgi:hypothetical protein
MISPKRPDLFIDHVIAVKVIFLDLIPVGSDAGFVEMVIYVRFPPSSPKGWIRILVERQASYDGADKAGFAADILRS